MAVTWSLMRNLGLAAMVSLLAGVAGGMTDDMAWATLLPPTISDLHVTNFNPFVDPPGATFGPAPPTSSSAPPTFAPAGASFNSQGFDFVNQFTNNQFSLSIDGHNLDFDHTYGLCGGMVYAALDTFLAGNGTTTPEGWLTGPSPGPGLVGPPESGPVFSYLYARELNSLEANNYSALREMLHMMLLDPYESEREGETSHYFSGITASIDAGVPVPLLIVEALSVGQVFENHQVLATGYFYRGGPHGQLVIQVYDPNFPGRFMYLNTHNTYNDMSQYPSEIETYDAAGTEYSGVHFYGFFTTPYSYVAPRWAVAKPTGNLLNDPGADWTDSTWNLTATDGHPPGTAETPQTELGAPAGTTLVVAPPDWTPTGNFTALRYAAPVRRFPEPAAGPTFPTVTYGAGIGGGNNYFAGGPGNSASTATQVIDLDSDSALGTLIDGGQQVATLSGDLGGSGDQPAEMVVTASFLSVTGAALGSLSIGPVGAADRNDQTEMLARTGAALIPRETRAIEVTMSATGGARNDQYNTAFADNLSLTITQNAGITVPVSIPGVR